MNMQKYFEKIWEIMAKLFSIKNMPSQILIER